MKVVCCFVESKEGILVVLRHNISTKKKEWDIPAGKVENDDTKEKTVKKIVDEETGYKLSTNDLENIGEHKFVSGHGEPYTMYVYRTFIDKSLQHKNGSLEAEWFKPAEILKKENLIKNLAVLLKLSGYES